jgi:aspartate racemase
LVAQGVRAIILGCTEIPMALQAGPPPGIPIIDSIDALAKSAIAWWQGT